MKTSDHTRGCAADIFVPDAKTGREWFVWMMDNLPFDQLIWETASGGMLMDKNIGILEEIVVQHPEMARMCPTSVNTCRIATLLGDKKQGIVYAFLRIGNGKVMDNVDCGGMAARIDLESGKLLTVGADKAGNTYTKHPITGTDIICFTIPYWEEAKKMCLDAAQKVPQMRFVAWDVAITPNGPTFIEGKYD